MGTQAYRIDSYETYRYNDTTLKGYSTYEGRSKSFATWHDSVKMSMHGNYQSKTTVFTYYNSVVVVVMSSLMMTSQRGKVYNCQGETPRNADARSLADARQRSDRQVHDCTGGCS